MLYFSAVAFYFFDASQAAAAAFRGAFRQRCWCHISCHWLDIAISLLRHTGFHTLICHLLLDYIFITALRCHLIFDLVQILIFIDANRYLIAFFLAAFSAFYYFTFDYAAIAYMPLRQMLVGFRLLGHFYLIDCFYHISWYFIMFFLLIMLIEPLAAIDISADYCHYIWQLTLYYATPSFIFRFLYFHFCPAFHDRLYFMPFTPSAGYIFITYAPTFILWWYRLPHCHASSFDFLLFFFFFFLLTLFALFIALPLFCWFLLYLIDYADIFAITPCFSSYDEAIADYTLMPLFQRRLRHAIISCFLLLMLRCYWHYAAAAAIMRWYRPCCIIVVFMMFAYFRLFSPPLIICYAFILMPLYWYIIVYFHYYAIFIYCFHWHYAFADSVTLHVYALRHDMVAIALPCCCSMPYAMLLFTLWLFDAALPLFSFH